MKKPKKTEQFAPIAPKEHGGACPTCGHCKCCEKKTAPAITFPPICTRRHYPDWDWTYRPIPVWYGTTTVDSTATFLTTGGQA